MTGGARAPRPYALAARDLALLMERSLSAIWLLLRLRVRHPEWFRQCFEAGNRSLLFVVATMGFLGAIMVLQGGYQAARLIGDYSLIGPAFLQLLVRELAPTIGALMITTRVGAGIAAQLGAMAVTEQLDALRMCGADPVEELVVPRLLAGLLMVPALVILAGLSAEVAGIITASVAFDVPQSTFLSLRMVKAGDLAVGMIKAVVFGAVIPLWSAHAGMQARRGSEGVGGATTRAVIHSSVTMIFLDFALNILLYPVYSR